ncbi:MAG: hypothetical protein ABI995_00575 [Acidobacteriota bacterium]
MSDDLRDGVLLERAESTLELRVNRHACVPFVPNIGPDLVRFEESQGFGQASAGDSDVLDKFRAACDHARFVVRREPHGLRFVELWIQSCAHTHGQAVSRAIPNTFLGNMIPAFRCMTKLGQVWTQGAMSFLRTDRSANTLHP